MKTEKNKSFIALTCQNPSVVGRLILQKYHVSIGQGLTQLTTNFGIHIVYPAGARGRPGTTKTGRLAPKTLPHSVTGRDASIPCAWALTRPLRHSWGPQKGSFLAQKVPFRGPGGPLAALGGLIWAQLPLVGPTGWATWL